MSYFTHAEQGADLVIANAIADSGLTDRQITDRMSALLGRECFEECFIYAYRHGLHSKKQRNAAELWPAIFDVPFCLAVGDFSLLRFRVECLKECVPPADRRTSDMVAVSNGLNVVDLRGGQA